MLRHALPFCLIAGLLFTATAPKDPDSVEPITDHWVAESESVPPDTLQTSVRAGTPVILSLPAEIGNRPVARYTVVSGPALSGVAGRSFTWITRGVTPGTYRVPIKADHPETRPDTVVVEIDVQS